MGWVKINCMFCTKHVVAVALLLHPEHGHADIPTFYTCDEGLSALTTEGQATLERLEGMLAQSVAQQYHMAGVRTEEANAEFEGLSHAHKYNFWHDLLHHNFISKCCSRSYLSTWMLHIFHLYISLDLVFQVKCFYLNYSCTLNL